MPKYLKIFVQDIPLSSVGRASRIDSIDRIVSRVDLLVRVPGSRMFPGTGFIVSNLHVSIFQKTAPAVAPEQASMPISEFCRFAV